MSSSHLKRFGVRTIGIIAALRQEVGPFIEGLEDPRSITVGRFVIHQGVISGRPVSLVISGVGRKAAVNAAEVLIESSRPDIIVSTGFAGGLAEEAAAGTIVYGNDLVDDTGGRETFGVPDGFALPEGGVWGVILTSRYFISAVDHRRRLRDRFGAVAVDMESIHIGRVARGAGIPVIVARIISDDISAELPVMGLIMGGDGRLAIGRAIAYFARHPGTIIGFVRFMGNLTAHAHTLNGCLRRLVVSLPAGE